MYNGGDLNGICSTDPERREAGGNEGSSPNPI